MKNQILEQVKQAIRRPYAWPGGYPIYIIMDDGMLLCPDCARKEYRQIAWDTKMKDRGGWQAIGADILWEGTEYCVHCNKELKSAYGPIEEEEE